MRSTPRPRLRFWFKGVTALVAWFLALLTALRPDWIELVFNIDPDAGSGSLEWIIVVAGAVMALATSLGTLIEWRRFAGRPRRDSSASDVS